MNGHSYRRGAIYWVDFTGSRDGEITKVRPAVVVSNDVANRHLNRVQVVRLTSNTGRIYPGEALVDLNGRSRKAMADQIATVAKERIGDFLGQLTAEDMRRVEQAIKRQLGLGST